MSDLQHCCSKPPEQGSNENLSQWLVHVLCDDTRNASKTISTIYANKDVTTYLEILNCSGRIVSLEEFDCKKYVLEDAGAACVRDWRLLVNIAKKCDLPLSSDYLVKMLAVYLIREDWARKEKLNTFILRLFEAYLFNRILLKKVDSTMARI